jgi:type I restriction enzyme S subunit
MKFKFDDIAINSTKKKIPEESDKNVYIGLEHIDSESFTITRWGAEAAPIGDKLLMRKGDVLFGKRRAYQRKVAIAPFDGIFSAHGMVLRPKENVVTKEFFPFFISSDQFMERAVRISVGGLSPTVNWKDLKEQEFELPSIEEQKVLAEKLWAAYRLKESYKKLLAATDEMVKSRFIEMFGTTHSPKYEVSTLGIECRFKSGTTMPVEDELDAGDFVYAKVSDMNLDGNEIGITHSKKYLSKASAKNTWLPAGTVVFPKRGAAIYTNKKRVLVSDSCVDLNIIGVIPGSRLSSKYLYSFFKSLDLKDIADNSGIPQINNKHLVPLEIVVPPLEAQYAFISFLEQADKSGFELRKSIENIDSVIKSLINN